MACVDLRNLFSRRGIYFKPKAGAALGPWVYGRLVSIDTVHQSKRWKIYVFSLHYSIHIGGRYLVWYITTGRLIDTHCTPTGDSKLSLSDENPAQFQVSKCFAH